MRAGPLGGSKGVEANVRSRRPCCRISTGNAGAGSTSATLACDCLAHRFGNARDRGARERRYPTDMSDAEWAVVRPLLPVPGWPRGRGGRPEAYCHRAMLDAIRYLVDNGTKWRAMPADFPPWDRVYAFFRRWRNHDLVREFHDRLRRLVRERAGRDSEPGAGVIDSQSVKADAVVGSDSRGFDGGKLINGRKRHVVVDTLGLLLAVMVAAADVGDRAAAQALLTQVTAAHHLLALVWADGGYTGGLVEYCLAALALVLAIVKHSDDMHGFVVLPKRWIVERFLAHLMRSPSRARLRACPHPGPVPPGSRHKARLTSNLLPTRGCGRARHRGTPGRGGHRGATLHADPQWARSLSSLRRSAAVGPAGQVELTARTAVGSRPDSGCRVSSTGQARR